MSGEKSKDSEPVFSLYFPGEDLTLEEVDETTLESSKDLLEDLLLDDDDDDDDLKIFHFLGLPLFELSFNLFGAFGVEFKKFDISSPLKVFVYFLK
ncbi:hypothetical protein WICMUC_001261 [Wickerhamomyces mucosus]|uniref:Uncharacterized protein n=1 Tax=Wickerhamomyces mucosus TaxID=1378264 RepID=A0A9P8THK2_9ASCO|nr:hypothetical protein WICMUC_001261 [Wickerhamomyces mucosus]